MGQYHNVHLFHAMIQYLLWSTYKSQYLGGNETKGYYTNNLFVNQDTLVLQTERSTWIEYEYNDFSDLM